MQEPKVASRLTQVKLVSEVGGELTLSANLIWREKLLFSIAVEVDELCRQTQVLVEANVAASHVKEEIVRATRDKTPELEVEVVL